MSGIRKPFKVVFEIRITGSRLHHVRGGFCRKRSTAKIRVQDYAGRVDHPTQRRRQKGFYIGDYERLDIFAIDSLACSGCFSFHLRAQIRQNGARRLRNQGTAGFFGESE
jgi:hypothetical protein